MTSITRSPSQGKLLLNGAPVALRGGAYDLFFDPGRSPEAIVNAGNNQPIVVTYPRGTNPCQTAQNKAIPASLAAWDEGGNSFGEFFAAMQANRCNFLRVFLFGGTLLNGGAPVSLSPFNRQLVGGAYKYDVRGAALGGRWNTAYFDRLRAFVAAADAAGVVVQLALFNYYDITDDPGGPVKTWGLSPWNAGNSLDAAWGAEHLIPAGTAAGQRQRLFVTPENGLRAVQQEFIGRVLQATLGYQNVILEVMNEPHQVVNASDLSRVAEFDSYMTGLIVRYRRSSGAQALISINASFVFPADGSPPGASDMETWRTEGRPNYNEIDLVSYHGLTAMGDNRSFSACGSIVQAPRVDTGAVAERANRHRAAHPDKALLYSTDAVGMGQFRHTYNNGALDMNVRDGQIITTPEGDGLEAQLLRSHVYHWAARCFAQGVGANLGKAHFHDHSTYRHALQQVCRAVIDAGL